MGKQQSSLAQLLHQAVDLLEGAPELDKTPRELALELDPADFGTEDKGVLIGLNYMKGRMQNLEDELLQAREFASKMQKERNNAQSAQRSAEWKLSRAEIRISELEHTDDEDGD